MKKIVVLRSLTLLGVILTGCLGFAQTVLTGSGPWKLQATPIIGQWIYYALDVKDADGYTRFDLSDHSGKVDLYLKQGAIPTLADFDVHPTTVAGASSVAISNETAPALQTGRMYIGVYSSSKSRYVLQVQRRQVISNKPGMGATPFAAGTTFRVWAPNATQLNVAGQFNGWNPTATRLLPEGNGNYSLDLRGANPGQQYKYVLTNGTTTFWKNDPRAKQLTNSVGNSIIVDPNYAWTTTGYTTPTWDKMVVYEMHTGMFNPFSASSPGNFDRAATKLDYLKQLGINTILLMPINEFPGDISWGYNPSYPFSVESIYGGVSQLKSFIDAAHARGIAVMLDVVYNHLGPNDLDMWRFDGWSQNGYGGIYFYNDSRAITPYGNTRPDFGRNEVRQYIHDCALMWLQEFRADGLRFDSTLNIRTTNSGDNGDGWSLMQWINDEVDSTQPWKLMLAEDMQGNNYITRTTATGGAGFDTQWSAQFVHPMRDALTNSNDANRNMNAVASAITDLSNGFGQQRMIYTESHDEDANGSQRLPSLIDTGNPASYYAKKRSTLGAAIVMTSPGIPMIFQGQEFLESGWFDANRPLDWSKATTNAGILQLYTDLIRLRQNTGGFTAGLTGGNINMYHVNNSGKVIAYHRYLNGGVNDDVVIVANFSNTNYDAYNVGIPVAGHWNVIFNSDWTGYSPDFGNTFVADFDTVNVPLHGFGQSTTLKVPPYSLLILARKASGAPIADHGISRRTR